MTGTPVRSARYDLDVRLDLDRGRLEAVTRIHLRNAGADPVPAVSFLLNRLLRVEEVSPVRDLEQTVTRVVGLPAMEVVHLRVELETPLPPGESTAIAVRYGGPLGDYVATGMRYVKDHVDPAFTILRRDAYAYPVPGIPDLAAIRGDVRPGFDWTARVDVPADRIVASGGRPAAETTAGGRAVFAFESLRPSWRIDLAVAPYETVARGDLRVHALPGDGEGARRVLGAVEEARRLFADRFGPLREPAPFTVIEIPDGWGSQADVTCILQTAAAFRDPARLVEVYHEVSHLWNPPDLDRPSPRWNEGLATFLQFEVADRLDGTSRRAEAVARTVTRLRDRLAEDATLRDVPFAEFGHANRTDLSYPVGLLMFDALDRRVGSETLRRILARHWREHGERGAGTADLVRIACEVGGEDLVGFFREWLFTTAWTERLG